MVRQIAKGRILRLDESPFRDTLVQLWDRDFGLDDKIGEARTNNEGNFTIEYDTEDAGDAPDLTLKVLRKAADGDYEVIYDTNGDNNVDYDYDFETIFIDDWEYDSGFQVPLIQSEGAGIFASNQNFVPSQTSKILFNGAKYQLIRLRANQKDTFIEAQNEFPENLTINKPIESRTDDFFVDSVLNGFAPAMPTISSDGTYHVRYNLDNYDWDGERQAPSVHLMLKKDENNKLVPTKIDYRLRNITPKDASSATFQATTSATPNDGEAWEKAKNYFRIAEFIDGQVKGHLGRAHLNVGQYAIAFYRNIQKSPISKLLHPHLKGVSAINTFGKDIIFGNDGVLVLSPLNGQSLIDVMKDDLGQCNWKDWSPRKELVDSGKHSYAAIQNLYWGLIIDYIEEFFSIYQDKIVLDWKEVYFFSKDLVEHSVPFFKAPLESNEKWYCTNEINQTVSDRQHVISPITSVMNQPSDDEVNNLKQACAYAIYHATIWHDWRNDNQTNYGGEIDYARLALNYTVEDAAFQLFIVNVLVDVKHGYLVKNEEDDIPRIFIALLKKHREKFEELGYDIRDLRSRINI